MKKYKRKIKEIKDEVKIGKRKKKEKNKIK